MELRGNASDDTDKFNSKCKPVHYSMSCHTLSRHHVTHYHVVTSHIIISSRHTLSCRHVTHCHVLTLHIIMSSRIKRNVAVSAAADLNHSSCPGVYKMVDEVQNGGTDVVETQFNNDKLSGQVCLNFLLDSVSPLLFSLSNRI